MEVISELHLDFRVVHSVITASNSVVTKFFDERHGAYKYGAGITLSVGRKWHEDSLRAHLVRVRHVEVKFESTIG